MTYPVPVSIPGKEEGVTHTVTAVGSDALAMADSLETLNFAKPDNIVHLDNRAFANAKSLISINGCTTWREVRKTFTNKDLLVGLYPCQNTKLYETIELPKGETIPVSQPINCHLRMVSVMGIPQPENQSEQHHRPGHAEIGDHLSKVGNGVQYFDHLLFVPTAK